ncbi:hypothetical protein BH10BAC2_BH10BAC2_38050 [soil metagenome]
MKYVIIIFVIFVCSAIIYKYFIAEDLPADFVKKIEQQQNPFSVPKDSTAIAWYRAKFFLHERRRLISAGKRKISDSVMYIPYSNSYHKGNSIKIERKRVGDSIVFNCNWWYSGNVEEDGSKEIALYMQTGEGRYDQK